MHKPQSHSVWKMQYKITVFSTYLEYVSDVASFTGHSQSLSCSSGENFSLQDKIWEWPKNEAMSKEVTHVM